MILDVTQPVIDYDGTPATRDDKPILLRTLLFQALDVILPGESLSGDDKMRGYRICAAVVVDDKVTLTHEDCVFIKQRSAAVNPVFAHGRVCDALEPPEEPDVEE